jgi:hypothetical protein
LIRLVTLILSGMDKEMFKLEFDTGNDAFSDLEAEISMILEAVGIEVRKGATHGKVWDSNGNTVGKWSLTND